MSTAANVRAGFTGQGYDEAWEDPLPHVVSPRKQYLRLSLDLAASISTHDGIAKPAAVAIFIHGRGDNADDMVGVFLPVLQQRFGGYEGEVTEDDGEEKQARARQGRVAVIGLEARDHIWYPQSHHAVEHEADINAPYQYSSLEKLRQTLVELVFRSGIETNRIVIVGFSQGAMLATNYILAALTLQNKQGSTAAPYMPIPGSILALSGSLFATQPPFPERRFGSEMDEQAYRHALDVEERLVAKSTKSAGIVARLCPAKISLRLRCGDLDRFFKTPEIEAAASRLAQAATAVREAADTTQSLSSALEKALQISVAIEPNAPHQITGQMMAALVATLDEIVAA